MALFEYINFINRHRFKDVQMFACPNVKKANNFHRVYLRVLYVCPSGPLLLFKRWQVWHFYADVSNVDVLGHFWQVHVLYC